MAQSVASASAAPSQIIRPIVRPPDRNVARAQAGAHRRRTWFLAAGIATLAAIAIAVFVALPEYSSAPVLPKRAAPTAAGPQEQAPKAPVDFEQLAVELDKAEQAQGAYEATSKSLAARGASDWAADAFAAAQQFAATAKQHFDKREFTAAQESYKQALEQLQTVTDTAVKVLEQELARGQAALASGQSEIAKEAFAVARRIDPKNTVAARGVGRAQTLDQVIALTTAASNDERALQWSAAAQKYREALALDSETTSASEGLARVEARIAGDAYSTAMSQGLAHLNAGRLNDARAAINRAGQIRPGAREVNDALAQVADVEKRRNIAAQRALAEEGEKAERWDQALAAYDAALAIDPALEFARKGKERVTPRLELARGLDLHIQKPERLTSAAVRAQAYELVSSAERISPAGPVLTRQVAQVRENLKRVEAPVRVALESDNATVVVIHRVGPLGAFERREVELLPGRYTVVGSRMGYRDVRREIEVQPGAAPPPVLIRCEERI